MPLWQEITAYVLGWLALTGLATALARALDRSHHPLRATVRMVRMA